MPSCSLDRKIADKRVFPAVDVDQSSTRKEEILLSPDELAVTIKLRRVLHALESQQAIDLLLDRLKKTRTNYRVPDADREDDPRPGVSSADHDVAGLAAVLSDDGWPYASSLPVAAGDPGRFHALFGRDSLITSLQLLPVRPDVARATLRALAHEAGPRRRRRHARGAGQDRARVPRRTAGVVRGLAARPVRLLRHCRRDVLVRRRARRELDDPR